MTQMTQTTVIDSPSSLRRVYDWVIRSANKPKAVWMVTMVSFAESSIFPLPPDLMLIPMILADRAKAWWLALLCTISSVFGGLVGYAIGFFLYETIGEWIIQTYHLQDSFAGFQADFQAWGFWIIALKGLTPIPFKLVTIASGVAGLDLSLFVVASIIARSFRFFLLAGLLWFFGEWARTFIERYLPWVLGLSLLALIGGFVAVKVILG